jgi:hypothetical protein
MRQFFFLLAIGITHSVLGQQSASEGALEDAEFVIKKERKHLLPEASRLFRSAPTLPCTTDPIKPLAYVLPDLFPEFDILPRKVQILRAQQNIAAKHYSNYLQGGHGNFRAPFLEVFVANKHHPKYAYGFHIKHLSAGEVAYFEESHNLIQLHGKLFTKTLCLEGEMAYNRDRYQLYNSGNGSTKSSSLQTLHQVGVRQTLANYMDGAFNYQVDGLFHYLTDAYQARENQWGFSGKGDYALNDAFTLKACTDLYFTKHSDTTTAHRNLWRFKPMLSFIFDRFDVQGGISLVYQNDACYTSNSLNVYPVLEVTYARRKWLRPYVGVSGDMQRNSLQSFLQENPLLAPQVTLRHTNERFVFYGGAKGDIVAQVNWHAGFYLGTYQNLHCFVNNYQDPGRFDIQYDPAATLFNTFGELTHTNRANTLTTRLRGDYFHYTLQELAKPWHRPRYQLDLLSTYCLYDKIVCRGSMYWLGGLEAQDVLTKAPKVLDDVFDVGLGIDYLWNTRFSIFFNCQNLLASKNERYLHYPARSLHFMAGLTYAW